MNLYLKYQRIYIKRSISNKSNGWELRKLNKLSDVPINNAYSTDLVNNLNVRL